MDNAPLVDGVVGIRQRRVLPQFKEVKPFVSLTANEYIKMCRSAKNRQGIVSIEKPCVQQSCALPIAIPLDKAVSAHSPGKLVFLFASSASVMSVLFSRTNRGDMKWPILGAVLIENAAGLYSHSSCCHLLHNCCTSFEDGTADRCKTSEVDH